jgi:hypothetical protein
MQAMTRSIMDNGFGTEDGINRAGQHGAGGPSGGGSQAH